VLIGSLSQNGEIIFNKTLKYTKGIRVCRRKEPWRFVIVGVYYPSVYLLCACRTGDLLMNSVGGVVDFQYRRRVMVVYVTSVLSCKERCNQVY
jgi:hypothetical protein